MLNAVDNSGTVLMLIHFFTSHIFWKNYIVFLLFGILRVCLKADKSEKK